jgi:multidrug transporter EmrE-like cation transporter
VKQQLPCRYSLTAPITRNAGKKGWPNSLQPLFNRASSFNMNSFLLLALGGAILTVGDLVMRKWVIDGRLGTYAIGILVYLVALNLLAQSYRSKSVAVASSLFIILNIVSLSIASYFIYGEKLTPMQLVGVALAIAAVACLDGGN